MFSMRMPPDVREALERAARADMRPVSQLALKILSDHLIKDGFLEPRETKGSSPRSKRKG
jgi:hypothetical protein